jgi:4-hydroxythreonine-4-phosphate dehydrogenase
VTPRIAITTGEPAGIGPELLAKLSQQSFASTLIPIGDLTLLAAQGVAPRLLAQSVHVPLAVPAAAGSLAVANGPYVLETLARAHRGVVAGEWDAIVTLPIQKSVIIESGNPGFQGHTEYFASLANCEVVMMLVGGGLRVALATTHIPLAQVSGALRTSTLVQQMQIIDRALRQHFALAAPRILVAGLNPHAGERGHLGREDDAIIAPAIAAARAAGVDASGPHPADTVFTPKRLATGDVVLAMYHDQGLPVLKYASFGQGVNVTLGLPFIRTSVDHGTGLDIAGRGQADPGSFFAAIGLAESMVAARHSA